MFLNNYDLLNLTDIAKKAALSAGKIIAAAQGKPISVNSKEGGHNIASCVVTEIDLRAQEAIIDTLSPTLEKYDLGLLAEEGGHDNSRFKKDYFWCIDPLDGTLAFSRDEDGYSTSIALISNSGAPILGVVYNPRTNCLYYAIKNNGAFKNESPFIVKNDSKGLTLLFDQSFLAHPNYKCELERIKLKTLKLGLNKVKLHPLGGAVMNGIGTIEFAPAIYYKQPKTALGGGSLWDFAASSIIQSEAGGHNSDYYGSPLDLNRKDTTFMNHKGVIFCSSETLSKKLI